MVARELAGQAQEKRRWLGGRNSFAIPVNGITVEWALQPNLKHAA